MRGKNLPGLREVITLEDLLVGYKRLKKKNKYKYPRIDKNSERFLEHRDREPNNLKAFLDEYRSEESLQLFHKNLDQYFLDPYKALAISKGPSRGFRPLLVPSPKDRLVFDSLLEKYKTTLCAELKKRKLLGLGVLEPEPTASAIGLDIQKSIKDNKYTHVLVLDYSAFFSNIDRKKLLDLMTLRYGEENPLVTLLEPIISNPITDGESVEEKTGVPIVTKGIPQGLSFSPIIASFYAMAIDDLYIKNLKFSGWRYIDDTLILGSSEEGLTALFNEIEKKSASLGMVLHPLNARGSKTYIRNLQQKPLTFLGVDVDAEKIEINKKAFKNFLEVVRTEIFNKRILHTKSVEEIQKVYKEYTKGWLNHYEKIAADKKRLYAYLDRMLYEDFFRKEKMRKAFYRRNENWIILGG